MRLPLRAGVALATSAAIVVGVGAGLVVSHGTDGAPAAASDAGRPPASHAVLGSSVDLATPTRRYTGWVASRLPGLVAATARLDRDVASGHLAAARRDWLAAHLDYARLGAAYNAFGDLDERIDGSPDGLPGGTEAPTWSGFLAVEHALWSGHPSPRTRALTASLAVATRTLQQDFASLPIDPTDLPLRAHEIMENALQFQLTGDADYGSGTTLATAYANTEGTVELLDVLGPDLTRLDPEALTTARGQLGVVQADLRAARTSDGTWTPVAELSAADRSGLDAAVGGLLETLSVLPGVLTPRNGA
jgi:high-affinity iron transporter